MVFSPSTLESFINNKSDHSSKGIDVTDTNSNKNVTLCDLSTPLAKGSLRRSLDNDSWLETQNHLLSESSSAKVKRGVFTAVLLSLLKSTEKQPTKHKKIWH